MNRQLVPRLLMAALFCPLTAGAQEEARAALSGVVVDESGGAIADAEIAVRSVNGTILRQSVAAADGTFTTGPLSPGSYWVEASAVQFATRRIAQELKAGSAAAPAPLRIELGIAPLQSDVTVTAQRSTIADVERTTPVVTVVEEDDVRGRPLATIGTALDGAPGVMVQQSTYGQASPFLRGLTGYQVLNLIDGIRFNNTTFRSGPNQYLAFIDPSQAERVEVMLGPASAQFGSDALGGAIHVLTPSPGFRLAAERSLSLRGNLFGATSDESAGGDATILTRGREISLMLGVSGRSLDDLRGGDGRDSHHVFRRLFGLTDEQISDVLGDRQVDTGFDQTSLQAKVAARLDSRQSLTAWYQRSTQTGVRGYKDLWGGLGRMQSDFDPQRLQFFYTRYERLDVGSLDWLTGTFSVNSQNDGSIRQNLRPTDRIVRDDVGVDAYGYSVQAGTRLRTRHALVFGGEIYDEYVDARRDETDPSTGLVEQKRPLYPNGSRYTTTGVFLQDVVDLVGGEQGDTLVAHLGGRFTHVAVTTDADQNLGDSGQSFGVVDSRSSYHDWTFNAGLTWQATRVLALNVLAGRGFRAPNLNDLGALGLNDLGYEVPAASAIDAGALIGASDGEGVLSTGRNVASLKSERLFNYEMGATVNWRRVHARVHGFDAELLDPIVRRTLVFPAGAPPSSLAGIPVTPIAPTAAQRAEGVLSVATSLDPRAVKAFVNEGRARYYGIDAVFRYRVSTRWTAEANYSYLVGHDLDPTRPVRRLPPQHGLVGVRYQPSQRLSWIEATALFSGAQEHFSGGDLTDERIGAARRRSDITDFFQGGRVGPFIAPGADGRAGTSDDTFLATGETVAQIRDRVLPLGATINGVQVADDGTRVPLYLETPGYVTFNLRAGFSLAERVTLTLALMNAFDRSYRVHGSGVDAPGRSLFAGVGVPY
jgi:hemoglobin/transferrin/lactoferrin receptor protein